MFAHERGCRLKQSNKYCSSNTNNIKVSKSAYFKLDDTEEIKSMKRRPNWMPPENRARK
jgi:hypothetical protein